MKMSFLVTFYNQKDFVKKCLDSIIEIEKPIEWEILIGDNGSTDGTIELVNKYINKYNNIYLYRIKLNENFSIVKKASLNRINLLKHCKGDFFSIIDGDDYYCDKYFLKKAIKAFNKSDISIVANGYNIVSNKYTIIDTKKFAEGEKSQKDYIKNCYVHVGSCIFRNSFKQKDFELLEKNKLYDDNDIVLYNLKFGYMYFTDIISYSYFQHNDSVYNSMDFLEKQLLNAQGYEVDRIYLNKYIKELKIRYNYELRYIYHNRKIILSNKEKIHFNYYFEELSMISDSYTFKILNYNRLNNIQKASLFFNYLSLFYIYFIHRFKRIIFIYK